MRIDPPVVTDAASNRNLTTLAQLRLEFDLSDNSENAKLAMWLTQASGLIERRTAHRACLVNETFTQTFRDLSCEPVLRLSKYPAVVVASVVEDGETLTAGDDYRVDADDGLIYRRSDDADTDWTATDVVVTYSAGYTPGADLPVNVERAAIEQVKAYRFGAGRDPNARNVEVAGAGSTQIWFDADPDGLCPAARGLLADLLKPKPMAW